MAAITAARAGSGVILLEHMEEAAKKILVTGNGKCNYTNTDQEMHNYYCDDLCFVESVIAQFSYKDTIRFFEEIGIRPLQKNGTCIYPESGQASSVRAVLLSEIERLHIPLELSAAIRSIHKLHHAYINGHGHSDIFEIETKAGTIYSRTCILATGGKAARKTGSDGSGYIYAKQLGHTVIHPVAALTALYVDDKQHKLPAGVRAACTARLLVDGQQAACESGELQITDYGISGIAVFQISRIAAKALAGHRKVEAVLDFKPGMGQAELENYLFSRFHSIYHAHQTASGCMAGFLPDKLAAALLRHSEVALDKMCKNCGKEQVARLAQAIKSYRCTITGTKDFNFAQVTAGGISVQEIDASSMESKQVPGLFFAGEIVDVDAKCGGYNLQWAWASGHVAGMGANIYDKRFGCLPRENTNQKSGRREYDKDTAAKTTSKTYPNRHRE